MNRKIAVAVGIAAVLAAIGLAACSGTQEEQASYEVTPEEELSDMQLGQTAVFDAYEVTLESVEVGDEDLTATITVKAHGSAQSLKAKYLEGGSMVDTSFPDGAIEVGAWESVTGTIAYSSNTISQLRWNNWGNEAIWTFENAAKDAADAAKRTSDGLEADYAWQAVEAYGEEEYPYGFDLNWLTGKLAEENQGESWYLKATANVKNEYGKEAEYSCEAEVSGTNESPQVTYFIVY